MKLPQNGKIDNKGEHFSQVLVIGDVILDRYISGTCSRMSPEAPVPILSETTLEHRAGGAANVALNLQSLGVHTTLMGITGRDAESKTLLDLLFDLSFVYIQKENIPTTLKTRYVVDGKQVLRIDRESQGTADNILKYCLQKLPSFNYLILSDYSKHFTGMIPSLLKAAREHFVHSFVDPKNPEWEIYRGAFTITPNLIEYEKAGGDLKNLEGGCRALRKKFDIENILLTRGKDGMFFSSEAGDREIPAAYRQVVDVTGAGDTVIASLVAALASGVKWKGSLEFANLAAGTACQKVGTALAGNGKGDLVFPK